MEILQYTFFQYALLGALFISICCGIIGTYVVTRRRVFIAGGITHASLGGLGLGILLGINPTFVAVLFAILASIAVQWLSKQKNIREDSAIAVCWSFGMALGIIFIFMTPGYAPNLTEYLFGNILTIGQQDLIVTGSFTLLLALFSYLCQRPILYVAFDAEFCKLQGFKSWVIDYGMTVLTAITIVLSIRLIGIVLLLSVLTLPQMMSNLYLHDYKKIEICSICIGLAECILGLLVSFYLNVPAGACIVSLMVITYFILRSTKSWMQHKHHGRLPLLLTALIVVGSSILLCGCATQNTAMTRSLKKLTTKYNIQFNGQEAYKQGVSTMEKSTNDDYSQRLLLHPVDALAGKEEVAANASFDRAIEKCQKAITTKSITKKPKKKSGRVSDEDKLFMTRSEFNPYLHNAYLLLGKSQFYKGDFLAAAATFSYTARHFWWLPATIAESHIWIARCHAVQGYVFDAEAELNLVIPQKKYKDQAELTRLSEYQNLVPRLQRDFSMALAEIKLHTEGEETQAIPFIKNARKGFLTKEQKLRSTFLIAQLQEENGDKTAAYNSYGSVVSGAKDYKSQFNARIAQTKVMPDGYNKKIRRKLNRMRRDSRNQEYLDQVYFALGNLALSEKDTASTIENYELGVEKSTRNGMDKAIVALRLGELTFDIADYVKAQKAYAAAISILPKTFKNYQYIAKLSSVLDELQTHAETVQLQDSLLHLASLPEDKLNKVIDKIIEDLIETEKEAEEDARLAEYEDKKSQNADPLAQTQTLPTVGQKDNSWYFYNSATVNAGKSEFQRKWGSRKPEDDWRRKNKTATFNFNEDETAQNNDSLNNEDLTDLASNDSLQAPMNDSIAVIDSEKAADPHNREYYLAQIPHTDAEFANSNKLIEDALYNMGVIINEKLENFPTSIKTFSELESRFPETTYRLDFYYAIYLMYMRMGQPDIAEIYRLKLMNDFPSSAYAIAVSDPNYIETLRAMVADQDSLYVQTYEAYLEGETATVHHNYSFVHDKWPLCKLMPKFMFLHALSFVQEGDIPSFKEVLDQLTAAYPESDVSPLASTMIKGIQEGRTVQSGGAARGLLWETSLKVANQDSTLEGEGKFTYAPDKPHLLLLAYATDSVNGNDLLFEIAKFNFENYLIKDFDLEIINNGNLSILVIRGFANLDELIDYRAQMDYFAGIVLPSGVTPIEISEDNFKALLLGRTFDDYFKFIETGEDTPSVATEKSNDNRNDENVK